MLSLYHWDSKWGHGVEFGINNLVCELRAGLWGWGGGLGGSYPPFLWLFCRSAAVSVVAFLPYSFVFLLSSNPGPFHNNPAHTQLPSCPLSAQHPPLDSSYSQMLTRRLQPSGPACPEYPGAFTGSA